MMKIMKGVSLTLFLVFLAFSVIHVTKAPPHAQPEGKAIILLDDGKIKAQWDDEKKLFINLPDLFVLFFIISTTRITAPYFSANFNRDTSFLIPIFHQSNYLTLTPKLSNKKNKGGINHVDPFFINRLFFSIRSEHAYLPRDRNLPCVYGLF